MRVRMLFLSLLMVLMLVAVGCGKKKGGAVSEENNSPGDNGGVRVPTVEKVDVEKLEKELPTMGKYVQLAAWYGFRHCIQKNDFVQAFSFLCDDWHSTRLVAVTQESTTDLLYKTVELRVIQGGIDIEFRDVVLDEPDRFIIEGYFDFADQQQLKEWVGKYGSEAMKKKIGEITEEELSEYFATVKKPQDFRFRKLGEKWYYLPNGW